MNTVIMEKEILVNGEAGLAYHYSVWQQEISVYQTIPFDAIVDYFK